MCRRVNGPPPLERSALFRIAGAIHENARFLPLARWPAGLAAAVCRRSWARLGPRTRRAGRRRRARGPGRSSRRPRRQPRRRAGHRAEAHRRDRRGLRPVPHPQPRGRQVPLRAGCGAAGSPAAGLRPRLQRGGGRGSAGDPGRRHHRGAGHGRGRLAPAPVGHLLGCPDEAAPFAAPGPGRRGRGALVHEGLPHRLPGRPGQPLGSCGRLRGACPRARSRASSRRSSAAGRDRAAGRPAGTCVRSRARGRRVPLHPAHAGSLLRRGLLPRSPPGEAAPLHGAHPPGQAPAVRGPQR